MNHIPIVAISDDKLSFALGTLFTNLVLVKKSTTFYEFFAILSPDTSKENIYKIKQVQDMYPDECSVTIIQMDDRFDKIPNGTGYIANACAYKMCIAEVLPFIDKIIYLDTDIVVFDDLTDLYNTDITDAYIGGVPSIEHYLTRRDLPDQLQIPDLSQYINAGVMVMNLGKIRRDNIEKELQSLIGTYHDSVDQHIFNRVCYGHIKLLSPKYNVFQSAEYLYTNDTILIGITSQELASIKEHPVIYHYTDRPKPWKHFNLKYHLFWFRNFKQSPFSQTSLQLSFCPNSVCRCTQMNEMYLSAKPAPIKWYKRLFSIDKKTIDKKRHTVIRVFGKEYVL